MLQFKKNLGMISLNFTPKVIDKGLPLKYYSYSKNYHSLKRFWRGFEPIGKVRGSRYPIASCSAFNQDGFIGYGGGFLTELLMNSEKKKISRLFLLFLNYKKQIFNFKRVLMKKLIIMNRE